MFCPEPVETWRPPTNAWKNYADPEEAYKALCPCTPVELLFHLASDYPSLILQNPLLPLLSVSDPEEYEALYNQIQFYLRFRHNVEISWANKAGMNRHGLIDNKAQEVANRLAEAYKRDAEEFWSGKPPAFKDWYDEEGVEADVDEFIAVFQTRFGNRPGGETLNEFTQKLQQYTCKYIENSSA